MDEAWRVLNIALSFPLILAMGWALRQDWLTLTVDERLFSLGTVWLLLSGFLGSILGLLAGYDFNILGTPMFSIACMWLGAAVILRIQRIRRNL